MNECCYRHRIRTVQCSQHIVFLVPRAALEESVQKPFGEEKSKYPDCNTAHAASVMLYK